MQRSIALALGALLVSSAAQGEDLISVYERALKSDPQIREADANRLAARESKPLALAALLPNITGFGQRGDVSSDGSRLANDRTIGLFNTGFTSDTDDTQYSVTLRQSVFSWSNWMDLRRADKQVAQAEADYQAAQQELIVRVAERYFDVLAAQDTVDAQNSALEAISRQLEQAEKRFEVGLIAITDVQEAKAARDNAAATTIAAKRSLASAEELLREIINEKPTSLAKPGAGMALRAPEPADEAKWVESSMNQNLALVSSRLAADIARDSVQSAFGAHLPSLDLVATKFKNTSKGDSTATPSAIVGPSPVDTFNNATQIQLQLSLPIFAGGGTQSRVRQTEYQWMAAKERFVRVSRQTERAARDAYLGVISEISRVNALRQALESSQTALKATEAGYEVGTRTAVDVLDARKNLAQAQTNYARSRYDYILNVIKLKSAAGSLDRRSLEEVNGWLEREAAK
jgi:outer membrane protein